METIRQKTIFVFLVMVLVFGAATSGAPLTVSCAPQACCCKTADARPMPIEGHGLMRGAHNCSPASPAPCCRLKPDRTKADLLISSRPKISPYRAAVIMPSSQDKSPERQPFATRTPILEDERIRAPLVPIYLLTLTILC